MLLVHWRVHRIHNGKDRARHPRQLRHPQASQGDGLAGATSALGLSFHANIGLVDQCRRELLLGSDPTAVLRESGRF